MLKAEIVIPWETYKDHKNEIDTACANHSRAYYTAHHHIYEQVSTYEHIHIGMWLHSHNTPETIAKWFSMVPNFGANNVQKIKARKNGYICYIAYHYGQDGKEPITPKTVDFYASDNTNPDDCMADIQNRKTDEQTEAYLNDIAMGKIKEYTIYRDNPPDWTRKNLRAIENALRVASKLKEQKTMATKSIMWVWGETRTGKTTMASTVFNKNQDCYIACDSNPLDNYQGQPVLILDDISSGTMTCKALLKLCDPNYNSPVTARYYNRICEADTIIVTSTVSPEKWWTQARGTDANNGSWEQLTARLNLGSVHIVSATTMEWTLYNRMGKVDGTIKADIPQSVRDKIEEQAKITVTDRFTALTTEFNINVTLGVPCRDESMKFDDTDALWK